MSEFLVFLRVRLIAAGGHIKVVKAQIHAGGRGKGGGVKVAKNIPEVRKYAKQILGMNLITHQTGPEGKVVKRLLIEQGVNIEKEMYVGITLDRAQSKNAACFSGVTFRSNAGLALCI